LKWITRVGGGLIVGSLLLLAGFLAGQRVVSSVDPEPVDVEPVLFEVEMRTLERVVTLGGEAQWDPLREVVSRRGGVITWQSDGLDSVQEGTVVATIDLQPIVVAQGGVPAFRDLARSAQGADVSQLQEFLVRRGFAEFTADGVYGPSTETAVKRWQHEAGATPSGSIALGDLLWVPSLPATFRFPAGLEIGTTLGAGDPLLEEVASTPTITLKTSQDQVNLLPVDPDVVVRYEGLEWQGTLGPGSLTDSGVEFLVVGPDEGPVCMNECGEIPKSGTKVVSIDVVIVPSTTGPAVPQVAIATDPSGITTVQLANGEMTRVDVLAMVDGMAVVDGIDPGQQVILP
jgi:peptidoglycan hydrolase-like protein with peptidoglycan-binding domain